MYNSIQKVKTIHILLLKIAPSKTFHDLTGREGRADQNNKSHCIIVLPPQICNSVQKKSKTIRSLRKILSCKESCNLIAQSDFDNIAQTRFPP